MLLGQSRSGHTNGEDHQLLYFSVLYLEIPEIIYIQYNIHLQPRDNWIE